MIPNLIGQIYEFVTCWCVPDSKPDPEPTPPLPEPIPPVEPVLIPPSTNPTVVTAINAARASMGLPALVEDRNLNQLATSWATSMATTVGMTHGGFADRIASVYPNTAAAENIAEGQPDATSVVAAWMADPPHRANILGDYNRLGTGAKPDSSGSIYWCADFVRID